MSIDNNKMQVDIENLFKQNVNDLSSIKELYKKCKELEEKISQIKYIDSTLAKKLKKEYESLKKQILDENTIINLNNKIEISKAELNQKIEANKTDVKKVGQKIETNRAEVNTELDKVNEKLINKTDKTETSYIQQQVNNLVLGAVGDGNNPEVIQARGKYSVLNERLKNNETEFVSLKNELGTTTVTRGINLLFLKDQHIETNGLIIDIKDQLITISGHVQDTGFHNYITLNVDTPEILDGAYSVYSIVTDEQGVAGRNDMLRLKFYSSADEEVAEKIAFNPWSLSDLTFSKLTDYKVKIYIQAQYTYTESWSFNLQLAKGHNGNFEKAYVNREFNLNVDNDIVKLNNDIVKLNNEVTTIKNEVGIADSENPLATIIKDSGFAGLIESYACVGDSLTQGVFDITNDVTLDFDITSFNSYPSQLARITGCKVFNLGNAGATACNSAKSISDWHSWLQTAKYNKWFTDEFKAKAYIFSIGTNDIGYYESFTGDVETDIDVNDYNNNDTTTSVGGLATMIQKAKELQPKALIFVETIDNTRNAKPTRDVANEKIRAIAEKLNCYLLDMAKYWIQEDEVYNWMSKYQNGGHLNAMGYLLKTQARITYIDWIIRNNLSEFKDVQFIGTNMKYK